MIKFGNNDKYLELTAKLSAAILSSLAAYKSGAGYVNLLFRGDNRIRNHNMICYYIIL